MNWPDERYVKLYVRDTANWQMLPWQSKALLPLLLRKFDGAGIMDTGKHDKTRAVALIVGIPADVVGPGLDGLVADGVVQHIDGGLVCPNFIDSQEACKTESQKKRDQRQRVKDQRMATQRVELTSTPVPVLSRAVPYCPPPAQPSPAQLKDLSKPPAVVDQFRAFWNSNMPPSVPKWRDHTEKRNRTVSAWAKKYPQGRWQEMVDAVAAQPFLTGSSGWTLSVDWLVKGDNATKVLERQYAGTKVQPRAKVAHF